MINNQKINWLKTLMINFKSLPFSVAIKLPIYIYDNTLLVSIGKILIDTDDIQQGMIRIGKRNFFAGYKTQFINSGIIHFKGKCLIEAGTCINNSGTLVLGKEIMIGERCNILMVNKIVVGDFVRIAFGTIMMDTDFHSIINTNMGIVKKPYDEISLGAYNWIGNRSMIKKGTVTADYTIVSSLSMLNRDYRTEDKYPLLAGCPAKIISTGWRRIYSDKNNRTINTFFKQYKDKNYIVSKPTNVDWDEFCLHGDEILRF